jgi:hypothetical protein
VSPQSAAFESLITRWVRVMAGLESDENCLAMSDETFDMRMAEPLGRNREMMSLHEASSDKGYAYCRYSRSRQRWPSPEDKGHRKDREHGSRYQQTRIETMKLAVRDAVVVRLKERRPAAHALILADSLREGILCKVLGHPPVLYRSISRIQLVVAPPEVDDCFPDRYQNIPATPAGGASIRTGIRKARSAVSEPRTLNTVNRREIAANQPVSADPCPELFAASEAQGPGSGVSGNLLPAA